MALQLYDDIGMGYSAQRQPDPRITAAILEALGPARTIVNVGAGTGSYEPSDRVVVAVEPSRLMIRQRPPGSAHGRPGFGRTFAISETAPSMLRLAVLTIHHWGHRERGTQ